MRHHVGLVLLMFATPAVASAQDQLTKPREPQSVSECTEELFDKAQASFQLRWRNEMRFRAERQLSLLVRVCADSPGHYQAQEQLKLVHEELAESDLNIALYYLKKFQDGKGGKLGALSRLKNIVERYPEYSKLDQVLSLLGRLSFAENKLDEAAVYYRRIIKDFPASQHLGEASIQLSEIEALRNYGRPIPQL